jgi:hypothetical protein
VELFDLYDATESINRRLLELNAGTQSKDLDLLTILTQIPMFDKSIEKAVEILYRDSKNVEDPSLPVFNTEISFFGTILNFDLKMTETLFFFKSL